LGLPSLPSPHHQGRAFTPTGTFARLDHRHARSGAPVLGAALLAKSGGPHRRRFSFAAPGFSQFYAEWLRSFEFWRDLADKKVIWRLRGGRQLSDLLMELYIVAFKSSGIPDFLSMLVNTPFEAPSHEV
jgi:hypothetical protein